MNIGRFSLFIVIVFGFILFMGTGETRADSVPLNLESPIAQDTLPLMIGL